MIRTSSKDKSDLVKSFTEHYKDHHPGISPHEFTPLVVNNEVKFVVEDSCPEVSCTPVKSDVDIESSSSFKCFECDKVLEVSSSVAPVQHWVKHGHNPITLKVVRSDDGKILNIKQLYKWIFR